MKAFKGQAKQRHITESPLARLKRRGTLNVFELTAADEILHAYNLSIGAPSTRDPDLGIPRGEARPDSATAAAATRIDVITTLQRWRKDLTGKLPGIITAAALFAERDLRALDAMHHWRKGTAQRYLLAGIRHFAALRGNTPRSARNWKL